MLKKTSILFLFMFFTYADAAVDVQVQAQAHAKVGLLICIVGRVNKKLQCAVDRLQESCAFTKQFAVSVEHHSALVNQKDMCHFFTRGFPIVMFVQKGKGKSIEWRVYDTQCNTMLTGKQYLKRGKLPREWAHHIADTVWPVLTGQPGFFSTKVAYCKELQQSGKKVLKHIYIADFDGTNEKLLVSTSTVNVSPRWNRDKDNPLLFYSEHTNKNVRLVMVDMQGERKVVANFDGINMLPAFSCDGKQVVFCASRGGRHCQLYLYRQGKLKKLTHDAGNNLCPTFCKDGTSIFFCSDAGTKGPRIYKYDFKTGTRECVTDGYCVSPSYCPQNEKLAYCRMMGKFMQLFVYDLKTKKHTQVTHDATNKGESSWSPCGNYLLFAAETKGESRLALLNLNSNDRRYISPQGCVCCYPCWSCSYDNFAVAA